MEVELAEDWPTERVRCAAVAAAPPPGWTIMRVEVLPTGAKKAQASQRRLRGPDSRRTGERRLAERMAASAGATRPGRSSAGGRTPVDLRPLVAELSLDERHVADATARRREGSARPRDVLAALGLDDLGAGRFPLAAPQWR